MKVFVFSSRSYDQPALATRAGNHELLFTEKRLTKETAHFAEGCDAVALFTADDASAPVLDILHSLGIRYIVLRSVGYDHVDLRKAQELGMRVANVPAYSPNSVAEHAVAMLMALNRKLIQGQTLIQLQDYRIDSLMGFDICGKTVGVIGTGKIGLAFARIMIGFGANVLAYDPAVNQSAVDLGVRYVSLDELLQRSQVISLHCPLTTATRHMISGAQFQTMRPGAILLNTSRGAIVNTNDLIRALENGGLGGAGLDVYEFEKGLFFEDHTNDIIHDEKFARLRSFKNVLITCHQGFLTTDAIQEIAQTTMDNVNCFQHQLPCPNELRLQYNVKELSNEKTSTAIPHSI